MTNGNSADGVTATGGGAANGIYMGFAMEYDGAAISDHQRKANDEGRAATGESLGMAVMGAYDMVYMLKAAMEKAQSLEPKDIAAVMPAIRYRTFFGGETGFGGKATYGSDIAPRLPVYITQIVDGKLVERAKVDAPAQ